MVDEKIAASVKKVLKILALPEVEFVVEHPSEESHGDYASNIALAIFSKRQAPSAKPPINSKFQILKFKTPRELAEAIAVELKKDKDLLQIVEKVEAAGAGFINFWLSKKYLFGELRRAVVEINYGSSDWGKGLKYMVEYAHPNTHKEMHIGHMRTLITGEALARILEAGKVKVFRANYQGDIGPHVAKAIWGVEKILKESGRSWEKMETLSLAERAHFLGEGYVRGSRDYEENKSEIEALNSQLYARGKAVLPVYKRTRKWSLDYYDSVYKRFGTKFDGLYFESEVAGPGKKIVVDNLGNVFEKSRGAVIFDGEKYGLHKRVFITKEGNPTYEAKDMGLAPRQYNDFPFDKNVHVVANEQKEYFKVVFQALELVDKRFAGRQFHLSMGMVNLAGEKMSSRTGVLITVDGLLEKVKSLARFLIDDKRFNKDEAEKIVELVALAAIKYSVLKINPAQNVLFDLRQSVNLEGNSGPYLQYTYARARSVLRKSQIPKFKLQTSLKFQDPNFKFEDEELAILRATYKFPEVVLEAGRKLAPNLVCNFLFDLAQKYNWFYQKTPIIKTKNAALKNLRLALTLATAQVLKNGLEILGIEVLERM